MLLDSFTFREFFIESVVYCTFRDTNALQSSFVNCIFSLQMLRTLYQSSFILLLLTGSCQPSTSPVTEVDKTPEKQTTTGPELDIVTETSPSSSGEYTTTSLSVQPDYSSREISETETGSFTQDQNPEVGEYLTEAVEQNLVTDSSLLSNGQEGLPNDNYVKNLDNFYHSGHDLITEESKDVPSVLVHRLDSLASESVRFEEKVLFHPHQVSIFGPTPSSFGRDQENGRRIDLNSKFGARSGTFQRKREDLQRDGPRPLRTPHPQRNRDGYDFSYSVVDPEKRNNYHHSETRRGHSTTGQYSVLLPDGRVQLVKYVADKDGYKADVSYKSSSIEERNKLVTSTPRPVPYTFPVFTNPSTTSRPAPKFPPTNRHSKLSPFHLSNFRNYRIKQSRFDALKISQSKTKSNDFRNSEGKHKIFNFPRVGMTQKSKSPISKEHILPAKQVAKDDRSIFTTEVSSNTPTIFHPTLLELSDSAKWSTLIKMAAHASSEDQNQQSASAQTPKESSAEKLDNLNLNPHSVYFIPPAATFGLKTNVRQNLPKSSVNRKRHAVLLDDGNPLFEIGNPPENLPAENVTVLQELLYSLLQSNLSLFASLGSNDSFETNGAVQGILLDDNDSEDTKTDFNNVFDLPKLVEELDENGFDYEQQEPFDLRVGEEQTVVLSAPSGRDSYDLDFSESILTPKRILISNSLQNIIQHENSEEDENNPNKEEEDSASKIHSPKASFGTDFENSFEDLSGEATSAEEVLSSDAFDDTENTLLRLVENDVGQDERSSEKLVPVQQQAKTTAYVGLDQNFEPKTKIVESYPNKTSLDELIQANGTEQKTQYSEETVGIGSDSQTSQYAQNNNTSASPFTYEGLFNDSRAKSTASDSITWTQIKVKDSVKSPSHQVTVDQNGRISDTPNIQITDELIAFQTDASIDEVTDSSIKVTDGSIDEVTDESIDEVTDPSIDEVIVLSFDEVTDSSIKVTDPSIDEVTDPSIDEVIVSSFDEVTDSSIKVTDPSIDEVTDPSIDEVIVSSFDEITDSSIKVTDPSIDEVTDPSIDEVIVSSFDEITDPSIDEATDSPFKEQFLLEPQRNFSAESLPDAESEVISRFILFLNKEMKPGKPTKGSPAAGTERTDGSFGGSLN